MQKKTVSRDTPLAEITLRRYERPNNLSKRELIKKICLSVGLLQPGDSRDVIVDVFHVILDAEGPLTSEQVKERVIKSREGNSLPLTGIASSNIRRQLKRLRDLFLIEKIKNSYRVNEDESLENIFQEKIKKFYINSVISRVEEYFKELK
jgi:predicted transcriptional regulator